MSNLLIVDDEQSYRQLLTLVFEGDGHYIRTAMNGREALNMLGEEPADVIISDVKMPDMDGSSFYESLQNARGTSVPPVIVMTGDTSNDRTAEFLSNHDLPVLRKPFTTHELLRVLSDIHSRPTQYE